MEKENIKFAPYVMLVDAVALDGIVADVARYFSPIVGRELPKADLALLLECLALDAGWTPDAGRQVQVVLVYEGGQGQLRACLPADLKKELDGKAFKGGLGEFVMGAYQPSGMATREALFSETLLLLAESAEAQHWVILPDLQAYGNDWKKPLDERKKTVDCTLFGMTVPSEAGNVRFEQLGFAVLRALGVQAEEIK